MNIYLAGVRAGMARDDAEMIGLQDIMSGLEVLMRSLIIHDLCHIATLISQDRVKDGRT